MVSPQDPGAPGEGTDVAAMTLAGPGGQPAALSRGLVRRAVGRATGIPEMTLLVLCVVAFVVFTAANSGYASGPNIESLFLTIVYTGIVAVGEAIVMIAGEFDLSVGSVAGMGAIVAGIFMTKVGLPVPLAIIGGIGAGALAGLINAVVIVRVGIPAFVATLSMLYMAQGVGYVLSGGDPVYPLPPDVATLARTDILGIPSSIWVFLVVVLVADLVIRLTTLGRIVYATGGNPLTTRLAGISIVKVKMLTFVLSGALASFGGIMLVSRLQRADASIGLGWELNVITACVVGGVALGGGLGTIAGVFLGLVLLQGVQQGLVIVGVDASLQPVVAGMILVGAVGFDLYRRRRMA